MHCVQCCPPVLVVNGIVNRALIYEQYRDTNTIINNRGKVNIYGSLLMSMNMGQGLIKIAFIVVKFNDNTILFQMDKTN